MHIEIQRGSDHHKFRVVEVFWDDTSVILGDDYPSFSEARHQANGEARSRGIPLINTVEDRIRHARFSYRR